MSGWTQEAKENEPKRDRANSKQKIALANLEEERKLNS